MSSYSAAVLFLALAVAFAGISVYPAYKNNWRICVLWLLAMGVCDIVTIALLLKCV
jgi:hypothetical protein